MAYEKQSVFHCILDQSSASCYCADLSSPPWGRYTVSARKCSFMSLSMCYLYCLLELLVFGTMHSYQVTVMLKLLFSVSAFLGHNSLRQILKDKVMFF